MIFKKSESGNRSLRSSLQTFFVRAMVTITTFTVGYSSVILPQKLLSPSQKYKTTAVFPILQDDSSFSPELMRPTYPSQVYNKKTKQWEITKPDETTEQTEGKNLPPPPLVLIEKK